MSKQTEAELRETICDQGGCWTKETVTDSGVTADLKGSWRVLLLDHHFQTCDASHHGEIVDGIAVYPNENNKRLRILELKPRVEDYPDAAKKFHKTIPLVRDRLPEGFHGLRVDIELHVKKMPTQTIKMRKVLDIDGTKFGVRAYRNGEQV